MSWFNFGKEFSNLWESYGTINNIVTGQFFGEYLFEKKIAQQPSYKRIKEVIAENFAERAKIRFKPASRNIARRILRENVTKNTLSTVWQGFTTQVKDIPHYHLAEEIKYRLGFAAAPSSTDEQKSGSSPTAKIDTALPPALSKATRSRLTRLRNYFQNNYEKDDSDELKELLEEWRIKDFLHVSMYLSLRPICEPAILEAVGSASKLGAHLSIDFSSKKVITMASIPAISWLFSTAASWTHYLLKDQIDQCFFASYGSQAISYLPSTTIILSLSTVFHLAEIAYIWRVAYNTPPNVHEDKKQIRQLAMQYIEKPLAEKIQHNSVTKKLGLSLAQRTVDDIAIKLIDETINHYWKTLSETYVWGMPLVN